MPGMVLPSGAVMVLRSGDDQVNAVADDYHAPPPSAEQYLLP